MLRFLTIYLGLIVLASPGFTQDGFEWEEVAPMSNPRWGHAAVTFEDRIYVFGGVSLRRRILDSVEIYDPVENSWEAGPALPLPLYYHAATVVGDYIYIIGGLNERSRPIDQVIRFDPNENRRPYRIETLMREPRYSMSVVSVRNNILVLGGRNDDHFGADTSGYWFNVRDSTWLPAPSLNYGRSNFGMVVDSTVIVIGGIDFGPVSSVEILVNGRWIELGQMRTARGHLSASMLGDSIVVAGGMGYMNNCEMFNHRERRWTHLSSMRSPRSDFALVQWDSRLYAIGGMSHRMEGIQNSVEKYGYVVSIEDDRWETPAAFKVAPAWPNPTNGWVRVNLPGRDVALKIADTQGRILKSVNLPSSALCWGWQTDGYPAGNYHYLIYEAESGFPVYAGQITVLK